MGRLLGAAVCLAVLCSSANALAQSPPAWSAQNPGQGCSDREGCHSAAIAAAILGAVPAVTLGVELVSGTRVRLSMPVRVVLIAVGAASIAAGAWDGYHYRDKGPGDYLPGPIIGGVLGGGSIIGNIIMLASPTEHELQPAALPRHRVSASPIWIRDASGVLAPGAALSGVLF